MAHGEHWRIEWAAPRRFAHHLANAAHQLVLEGPRSRATLALKLATHQRTL